ncbi:hypothetical protein RB620_22535 [Paenibacillus sp. LHD-117]|uniref:hypothetical protein n=1 Tax=Paenibacillus sp. LHD-117 TaxID=3071412 RepID=UPI0027DF08F3|nr:hypothetical protein [Paenibacillus sp. LHD-117]MDQ6422211.1 hypothetical protein [Paenibacillus sp. LHD-117]
MKKLTLKLTVPILLLFVLVAALFYVITIYTNSNQPSAIDTTTPGSSVTESPASKDPRDEVVKTYLSLMEQEKYSEMRELWPNASAGNTESDPNEAGTLPDKIPPQNHAELDFTPFYKYQHDSVVSLFGENAWQNVDYEFTKIPAPDHKAKMIEKSTGKEISYEESVRLNQEYWKKVIEENNWTEKDVFSPEGVEETQAEREQREKNHAKYIDGEPTEYVVEELYESYVVDFKFGGKQAAESGEHQFKITIINPDGKWVVFDMLTWNPPISEHNGDK